jgi:hypothetical protein
MTSRRFYGSYFRWFEGGHLLPMERPVSAAEQILALLRAMGVGDLPGAVDHCAREVLAAAGSATPFRSPA